MTSGADAKNFNWFASERKRLKDACKEVPISWSYSSLLSSSVLDDVVRASDSLGSISNSSELVEIARSYF